MSSKRYPVPSVSTDKKVFSATSDKTKKVNVSSNPMRGGIRL